MDKYFSDGYDSKYPPVVSGPGGGGSGDSKQIEAFFNKYSSNGATIEGEEIEKLFKDLSVDMEDAVTLLISYYMGAKE